MDIKSIIDGINAHAVDAAPLGSCIKFQLDDNIVIVDGTGGANVVSTEDKEADCTIITSMETFGSLQSGDLNPMMAVMSGKIKIKGDMGAAMKLQSILG